jgi:hypothetical protein
MCTLLYFTNFLLVCLLVLHGYVFFLKKGLAMHPDWLRTPDPPACTSWVLKLQTYATIPSLFVYGYIFWGRGSNGFWTQGLTLARQAVYNLNHAPSLFALVNRVLDSCPGWPGPQPYLCFPHSWRDRHVLPHPVFICWDGLSQTLCPGWPQMEILQISASLVAMIIGVSLHTQL